jgi:hypothetical protein
MYLVHVFVSLTNLIVLLAFIAGVAMGYPKLLAFGVIGGYVANLAAIVVAVQLAVILAIRIPSGNAVQTLKNHWLGFANGAIVAAAWSTYFAIG